MTGAWTAGFTGQRVTIGIVDDGPTLHKSSGADKTIKAKNHSYDYSDPYVIDSGTTLLVQAVATSAAAVNTFNMNYGFGLIDAAELVSEAAKYSGVTPPQTFGSGTLLVNAPVNDFSSVTRTTSVNVCGANHARVSRRRGGVSDVAIRNHRSARAQGFQRLRC